MRISRFAAGLTALLALTVRVEAGEIFICNDGRTLELNASNRMALKNDPCVVEWFKNNSKPEAAKPGNGPQSMTRDDKWGRGGSSASYYPSWQSNPTYSYYSYGYTPYGWAD